MNQSKYAELVFALQQQTLGGKVDWRPEDATSIKPGKFACTLGKFTISFFTTRNDNGELDYILAISDQYGAEIDRVSDVDLRTHMDSSYSFMQDFYKEVRQQALGVDKALNALISELKSL
jgi:hypothetical protein